MNFYFILCTLLFFKIDISNSKSNKCTICKEFNTKFSEGLERTSSSNFGGGNTNWEEKHLGSFSYSETRLLEILDHSCTEDNKIKCHQLVEENEELLEKWWFLHFARGEDTDLFKFLCVESLKVCCPDGTFGKECKECPGGQDNPCNHNGVCEGNGTRMGDGTCSCNHGYAGEMCESCSARFYQDPSAAKTVCLPCHTSCNTSCSGDGSASCLDCKTGWTFRQENGCTDIDECVDELANCTHGTYCSNTDGNFNCLACHPSCDGCLGYGHHRCLTCAHRHLLVDDVCKECHAGCANTCLDETGTKCDACRDGWILAENNECTDIDECANGASNCQESSYCSNNLGSFSCIDCHELCSKCRGPSQTDCLQCKQGYLLNEEGECSDVDECAQEETPCKGVFEECSNTKGGFKCECMQGYVRRRDSECFKKNIVKKKKKNEAKKEDVPPITLEDSKEIRPGPNGFSQSDLDKLGKPVDGKLIDEPIRMQGSANQLRDQNHDDL